MNRVKQRNPKRGGFELKPLFQQLALTALERMIMKQTFLLALVFSFMACQAVFAINDYETTAKLPENKQIWPMPEIETTEDIFYVKTEFVESMEILSVTQGNWREAIHLVKYKIIEKDRRYPHAEIRFVVKDTWPAEGSNIKMKKLIWPFRKGIMFFYLKKDENCEFRDYFDILSYSLRKQ